MPLKTVPFNAEEFFDSPTAQRELLRDAFASGEPSYIAQALGVVARATGIAQTAEAAGVTRAALYKGLNEKGDPKLSTLIGVLKAAGFELTVKKAA